MSPHVPGAGVAGVVGTSSTYCNPPPFSDACASMRPLLLMLIAFAMLQLAGTRGFSSLVPFTELQIHPPASLVPTTTPELFIDCSAAHAKGRPSR